FVLANENRTQDAGHALLRQGRNPKVRKNSGVIYIIRHIFNRAGAMDLQGRARHALDPRGADP
ncbi:hypothetical protein, partial [Bifidobacterium merycicum]|uniref:hypothetical protein n=1 Tax=Bifidobacterium merycicum TaxID=78345 RepID=UPI0023F10D3D